ncbi:MAG: hypothetical protein AAF802_22360 [Planctomycetota bacterium]
MMRRWIFIPALAVSATVGTAYRYLVAQDVVLDNRTANVAQAADAKESAVQRSYETAIAITSDGQPLELTADPTEPYAISYWARTPGQTFRFARGTTESDRKASQVAEQYNREANDEKKSALLEEVKSLVAQAFDEQMAVREKEIERVQAKLDELKAKMKSRKELADDIIERRVRDLTRQPHETDWFEGTSRFPTLRTGYPIPPMPPETATLRTLRGSVAPTPRSRRGLSVPAANTTSPASPPGAARVPGVEGAPRVPGVEY